jgi:hypothetical protein
MTALNEQAAVLDRMRQEMQAMAGTSDVSKKIGRQIEQLLENS